MPTTKRSKRIAARLWWVIAAATLILAGLIGFTASRPGAITPVQAAVLGVVEGLTEYLPVSSTGHLILAGHAMGLSEFGPRSGPFGHEVLESPGVSAFDVVIQFGAILAVLGLYRGRVAQMARGLLGRDAAGLRLAGLLTVSFLPAMVGGLVLHHAIKEYLFGPLTVSVALILGGLLMIGVESFQRRRGHAEGGGIDQMAYWQALVIGLAQVLAMWPGTSRSMITILAAMLIGMNRLAAAEFSFLLALPTLGAATLYEAVQSHQELISLVGVHAILIGTVSSALVAALAVKLFVKWLSHRGLAPFGFYRVLAGIALLWYFRSALF